MYKFLFFGMDYVYEACNSTTLNLSIGYGKISLGLLNYRPQINHIRCLGLVICMYIFLLLVQVSWLLFVFYLVGCKIGFVDTCLDLFCREVSWYCSVYLILAC